MPRRRLLFSALCVVWTSGLAQARDAAWVEARESLDRLAARYAITVVSTDPTFPVRSSYGSIEGRAAEAEKLETYAPLLITEFSLYPPELVKKTGLQRIVLCQELAFAGQRRNAVPDYRHDTLYLDVARGSLHQSYLRKVIHHEFFHIIDWKDDGQVYRDERWASLNPPEFRYGNGGKAAQDMSQTSVLSDKYAGFLNHYSTTGVEEDKAEIFANLLVNPEYVEQRTSTDPVLRAKVARLKGLLVAFCPDVTAAFWVNVARTRRGQR